jgi:hypothetical protein
MADTQDTQAPDGKDVEDVTAHRAHTQKDAGASPQGNKPYSKLDAEDDTEGHLYGAGPSTQGEAFPHPGDNPHGDR